MNICIIGIDVGFNGGISVLADDELIFCERMPTVTETYFKHSKLAKRKILNLEMISDIFNVMLHEYDAVFCGIEQVNAYPREGAVSSFRFGYQYGALTAMTTAYSIPTSHIKPREWKQHFSLSRNKQESLDLAKTYWPNSNKFRLKKDDGKAESALIAKYMIDVILT